MDKTYAVDQKSFRKYKAYDSKHQNDEQKDTGQGRKEE